MKKITIFAMTKKGYAVVSSIHQKYPDLIDAVIGARDESVAEDYYEQLKNFCLNNQITFIDRSTPHSIESDYTIAISWRWLIHTQDTRLIVFHDSLLPRHRGFNPLVTALINGDDEIGVTALYASKEYDKGDIIARSASSIEYPITIYEATEVILNNYTSLALEIADYLIQNKPLTATPQTEEGASYSLWRDEEDYLIDWKESAKTIRRLIDALGFPYKGAASTIDGKWVRIVKAEALPDVNIENRTPGKIIFISDAKPVVVCGKGLLKINELVDDAGASLLPLKRFRVRFKGKA